MAPRQRQRETIYISLSTAVRRTGLSHQQVRECIERQLVAEPLTDRDLAELRRIRRLQELGANLQGIEMILHMRQRIQTLQAELNRLRGTWYPSPWREPEGLWQRRLPWQPDDE